LKAKNPPETERIYAFGPAQYAYGAKEPFVLGMEITRKEMVPKIISGEYRGLSTGYIVRKWKCSICNHDLEECPHEVGKKYDNATCQMLADDVELIDISVVDVPKDPRCRIIDLLITKNGKHAEYIWYGFRANTELDRFRNIQKAYKKGLIPEKAALFFAEFFSITSEGKAVFS
jgi:hypothetical protein